MSERLTSTAVLDALRAHVDQHGYAPSIRELGAALGGRSNSIVSYWLDKLERQGHIRRARGGKARAIVITEASAE
jgi:repressor LexA